MQPTRKKLPHDVPSWVPDDARYFITVNTRNRGQTPLLADGCAERLLNSIGAYEELGKWYVWIMVIMPDHVHMIASFSREPGLRSTMRAWKGFQARGLGIQWQPDFFEHRLRNSEEFTEKFHYVLLNPVRKGLVTKWQDWPFTRARGTWAERPMA